MLKVKLQRVDQKKKYIERITSKLLKPFNSWSALGNLIVFLCLLKAVRLVIKTQNFISYQIDFYLATQ